MESTTPSEASRYSRAYDRAISDVVGFAVIFGIAVLSIALIYTVGIGALNSIQHGEGMNNVDRAFDIVAENMADIHRNGAPARSTELQFPGGQLAITGQVSIELVVQNGTVPNASSVTPISYRKGTTGFFYVSGAVIRTDRGRSVMVREPPFRFGPNRTVVSFVSTLARGETDSAGGTGSVRLTARRDPPGSRTKTATVTNGSRTVNYSIHLTSPRFRAWKRYFERQGFPDSDITTDPANDTLVIAHETEELYVRKTNIGVALSS